MFGYSDQGLTISQGVAKAQNIDACAFDLGIGQGVVAGQFERGAELVAARQFQAANLGLGDIEVGAENTAGVGVVGHRCAVGVDQLARAGVDDLVGVVGVENRGIATECTASIVVSADFAVDAFFGLEIWVAPGLCAAALWQADVGVDLGNARRLEALGHATLDSPGTAEIPYTVQARSPVAAKEFVVIQAQTARQAEVTSDGPFVFHKQRFLGERSIDALAQTQRVGVIAIALQLVAANLKAGQQHVIAQRYGQLSIQHGVAGLGLGGLQLAFSHRSLLRQAQVGHAKAPAPLMAQCIVFTDVFVLIAAGGRRESTARRGPEFLGGAACFQHEFMVFIGREPQAQIAGLALGLAKAVQHGVFLAALIRAPELQTQSVGDQWAGQIEITLIGVACFARILKSMLSRDRTRPVFGYFAGNDIDHAAHGFGAIQRRHGAAHDFNALNGLNGRNPVIAQTFGNPAFERDTAGVLATAINHDEYMT